MEVGKYFADLLTENNLLAIKLSSRSARQIVDIQRSSIRLTTAAWLSSCTQEMEKQYLEFWSE